MCYSGKNSCRLDSFTKSGKVSFVVRSFIMTGHMEKLGVSSAPAEAVIPKSKGAKAVQFDHSMIRKRQVIIMQGALPARTVGCATITINAP